MPADVEFRSVRLFDGDRVRDDMDVVVRDGIVVAVESAAGGAVDGAVDGRGCTLIPGLIDAHVHVFDRDSLVKALAFGVTTVLDMFTTEEFASAMRAEQSGEGGDDRAEMFSAGLLATAPGSHGTQFGIDVEPLDSVSQVDGFVARRVAAGADYLKLVIEDGSVLGFDWPTLSPELVAALVAAGHDAGVLVVAHATKLEHAEMAVEAGVDGLAHVFVDRDITDHLVELMTSRGVFMVPTLTVPAVGMEPVGEEFISTGAFGSLLSPADIDLLKPMCLTPHSWRMAPPGEPFVGSTMRAWQSWLVPTRQIRGLVSGWACIANSNSCARVASRRWKRSRPRRLLRPTCSSWIEAGCASGPRRICFSSTVTPPSTSRRRATSSAFGRVASVSTMTPTGLSSHPLQDRRRRRGPARSAISARGPSARGLESRGLSRATHPAEDNPKRPSRSSRNQKPDRHFYESEVWSEKASRSRGQAWVSPRPAPT